MMDEYGACIQALMSEINRIDESFGEPISSSADSIEAFVLRYIDHPWCQNCLAATMPLDFIEKYVIDGQYKNVCARHNYSQGLHIKNKHVDNAFYTRYRDKVRIYPLECAITTDFIFSDDALADCYLKYECGEYIASLSRFAACGMDVSRWGKLITDEIYSKYIDKIATGLSDSSYTDYPPYVDEYFPNLSYDAYKAYKHKLNAGPIEFLYGRPKFADTIGWQAHDYPFKMALGISKHLTLREKIKIIMKLDNAHNCNGVTCYKLQCTGKSVDQYANHLNLIHRWLDMMSTSYNATLNDVLDFPCLNWIQMSNNRHLFALPR